VQRRFLATVIGLICALGAGCDEGGDTNPAGSGATGAVGGGAAGPGGGGDGGGGDGGGGTAGSGPGGGGSGGEAPCDPAPADNATKLDLLLVVDNSRSMGDKQELLAAGAEQLVGAFLNPRCIDDASGVPVAAQPALPADPCPGGSSREFAPVTDLRVAVISSSIGGHGADACDGSISPTENDQAHLLDRADPEMTATVPTWDNLGFLVWDPNQAQSPPGECHVVGMHQTLAQIVNGVGQIGCGYEAQLESWYRFLVQPDPYDSIQVNNGSAQLLGTDQALLDQRAAFLRPDSVLLVVMLSDENDCSTRDGGQFFFANQIYGPNNTPFHLPRPRAACATDPNSPCCRSCGQAPGPGCDASLDNCNGALSGLEDSINLRCFDQKRRFGIDFMWPVDRYVAGLTAMQVPDRMGNLVPNPLFGGGRSPSDVFLAGIVGVPWQDVARRDAGGVPDLLSGLDALANPVGGLQTSDELVANGTWDVILGDPATYVAPDDPLMAESVTPRTGANPITGDALAPPGAALLANPINGHEYSIPQNDNLQYACVFPLTLPRDCTNPGNVACDCPDAANDNPLCQAPDGSFGTMQYYAKAYPAVRELRVLEALGSQAVVGSVCAAQVADPTSQDWAYNATFDAMAETMRDALGAP
jgi:hypothetical protein